MVTGGAWSCDLVRESTVVVNRDADALDSAAVTHTVEDLARDRRQQGPGEDVADVSGAARDLGATVGDPIDDRLVVGEQGPVMLPDAVGDAVELETDDPP